MITDIQLNPARKPGRLRAILLALAILTSPCLCIGAIQLLDALPPASLPSGLSFVVNLFESEARVENRTSETFYVTPITTTYRKPQVIPQNTAFRYRDIPLQAGSSVTLAYDAADLPLAGIAVCRTGKDCRLLAVDNSNHYYLDSYEDLPALDPNWLQAIQSYPLDNYNNFVMAGLSFLPILLFAGWLILGRLQKKQPD